MISFDLKLTGVKKVKENMRKATKRYTMAAGWGGWAALHEVISIAVQNAPQETGALAFSGYVTNPSGTMDVRAEGGFGGPAEPYSIGVNRRTSFFTRAADSAGTTAALAATVAKNFAERGLEPKRRLPKTPHNSRARAAKASKGGR